MGYSTIKTDRKGFEELLNCLDPIEVPQQPQQEVYTPQPQVSSVVDKVSPADMFEVRMFDFDYDGTKKGLRKKARKTILNMIKHIVPDDIVDEAYIQDKIEQDIETLTDLYMQKENNIVMQKSLMESVAKGNSAPRMYEVFTQMTGSVQAINKQIVDTEQRIRKTYLDLKFETRDMMCERIDSANPQKALGPSEQDSIVTSTKNLILEAKQRHIDRINNAKKTDFVEEDD